MILRIDGGVPLKGRVSLPSDKSILHRALFLAACTKGLSYIKAQNMGNDNLCTARVLTQLGVCIEIDKNGFIVKSEGLKNFKKPDQAINCENSGTTMRLLSGILAGLGIESILYGDNSLNNRPMKRICEPLRKLGANIQGRVYKNEEYPPLKIGKSKFKGGKIDIKVPSAQVKSTLLLAALCADKKIHISSIHQTRDHTENLLQYLDVDIQNYIHSNGMIELILAKNQFFKPFNISIPGGFSSSAFFLATAISIPDSYISFSDVSLNKSRCGFLDILQLLGADITITNRNTSYNEPVGDIQIAYSNLSLPNNYLCIEGDSTIKMIDEIPLLSTIIPHVKGRVEVAKANELRFKESDRIKQTILLLDKFGISATEKEAGFYILAPQKLSAANLNVNKDHRLALTSAVLALQIKGKSILHGFEIAMVSFPNFQKELKKLGAKMFVD